LVKIREYTIKALFDFSYIPFFVGDGIVWS
jgi:hypothetical protein